MVWGEQGAAIQVWYDNQRLAVRAEFNGAAATGILARLRALLGW
jgi:hypothetical protein